MGRAIRKYGKDNFMIEVIDTVEDELANGTEHKNILKYNCVVPNGYNMNEYGRVIGLCSKDWYIGMTSKFYKSVDKSDILVYGYFLRILDLANKNFIIMKTHKTSCNTWTILYKLIGAKKRQTQQRIRKFCEIHNIFHRENRVFILNETLFQIIY